jgi:hypothetical protein
MTKRLLDVARRASSENFQAVTELYKRHRALLEVAEKLNEAIKHSEARRWASTNKALKRAEQLAKDNGIMNIDYCTWRRVFDIKETLELRERSYKARKAMRQEQASNE